MLSARLKEYKGFTLIELLVVISIIGLLATILIANLSSMRGRARDAVRKSDLRQLTAALRLYYNDQGGYPCASGTQIAACGAGHSACTWGTDPLAPPNAGTTNYISQIPADPTASSNPADQYQYSVIYNGNNTCGTNTATAFSISAFLENPSDPDVAKSQGRCPNFGSFQTNQYVVCAF